MNSRLFPIRDYLGAAASFPDDSLAASDAEIDHDPSLLRRGLAALADGYIFAAHHPAQAEQDLIRDNKTALAHSANIIVATGNATAPTFLDAAGQWGSLSDASFAGITQIMAEGGLFKKATPPPARQTTTPTTSFPRVDRPAGVHPVGVLGPPPLHRPPAPVLRRASMR